MYTRLLKKLSRTRLDDVLIDEGVLERPHIQDAQAECEMTGRPLSYVLFERGEMDEWELAKIVARNYSLPFVDVAEYSTPAAAEMLLDIEFCRTHMLLPFDLFGTIPAIAVCEMPTPAVLDEIEERCGELPFVYVTLRTRLLEVLKGREEGGSVPATAADMPARAPRVEPREATSPAAAAQGAAGAAVSLDLEAACMRLGFNMHMRSAGSGASLPPSLRPKPATAKKNQKLDTGYPAETAVPSPRGAAAEPEQAPAAAPKEKSEQPAGAAAWQSIFDLGDDAVDA